MIAEGKYNVKVLKRALRDAEMPTDENLYVDYKMEITEGKFKGHTEIISTPFISQDDMIKIGDRCEIEIWE